MSNCVTYPVVDFTRQELVYGDLKGEIPFPLPDVYARRFKRFMLVEGSWFMANLDCDISEYFEAERNPHRFRVIYGQYLNGTWTRESIGSYSLEGAPLPPVRWGLRRCVLETAEILIRAETEEGVKNEDVD